MLAQKVPSVNDQWQILPPELLDSLPASVCVLDKEGVIRDVNESWRLFAMENGFRVGNYGIGTNYLEVCDRARGAHDQEAAAVAAGIRGVLSGRISKFSIDYPCHSPHHRRWFRVLITALPDLEQGALVSHVDITERRQADRELRRSDDQLLQAQKMEAVGRLAGGVAHDFNNLLTLITGYSELLLSRMPPADPNRPELEEIRKAANRGASLTAQLLAFSRRQRVEPKILDLNQLVGDMEKMLRRMIGEDIQLIARLTPALGKVKADPGQVGQVIMNLALNARDAMPRGGRIVIQTENVELRAATVPARAGLEPGPYVALTFEDSGHGMDPQIVSQIFEPFFTTKEPGKGTGLGLSTVYGIVKQSCGDVWVDSIPGKGTKFTIYLPQVQEMDESASVREPQQESVGTETVLLVEDEAGVRRLLKHVLAKQGYTVIEAASGEEAVEVFERYKGRIHLLLTDMVMPRMNGRELADRLIREQPDLRVLYVSGYTDDVLIRNGALGPGMFFLQKPLKPQDLIAKVREVLDTPAVAHAP